MASDSKAIARGRLADAGVEELPDDWDVVTLGDLFCDDRGIAVGVMYPGDHVPDGVPIIKAGDLNGSIINPQPDFRISKNKHHEYRRSALEGGELLMTLVGNVGQCAVVPASMAGWNAARAVAVMRLVDSSETHFVQQCLLSRPLQHLMDVWSNTTVQATLNLKEIRQLPLPWPPKSCRDAIASFGKALDDKIELNRRMNATLQATALAIFTSWFVDFDPVKRNAEGIDLRPEDSLFPDSLEGMESDEIPKGWKMATVSEISENIFSGGTPQTKDATLWNGEFPWLASGETRNSFIIGTEKTITRRGIEKSSTRLARNGCVVIASAGQGHTRGQTSLLAFDSYINQSVIALAANQEIASDLFLYFDLSRRYEEFRQLSDSHSSRGSLTTKLVGGVSIVLPPKKIIVEFDTAVSPLVSQIVANLRQSATLSILRETLLPRLLSGEIKI